MYGYGGRILTIDLNYRTTRIDFFGDGFARKYLGGNGFVIRLLYNLVRPRVKPFDPENVIVFATGPINDTCIPSDSRICVGTKSPLNGLFFDSTFGGRFPVTQKRTGFDAIVITGKADRPVYLVVNESGVSIKSAESLWGLKITDTIKSILEVEGPDADAIAIGPAGENRVRFAAMGHFWKNRGGISGRGGIGAVMGSKNVKALVVRGNRKTEVADLADLKALVNENREALKTGTAVLKAYGTQALVDLINTKGALGTRNLRYEVWDRASEVNADTYKENYFEKDTTCYHCSIACGKDFAVKEGEYAGLRWKMPEFETIFAFGSMLDNSHAASLIKANELCDELGMDTISLGVTLAFVTECFEQGLLTRSDTGGIDLRFGDYRLMNELIEATAFRRGFGNVLAEGSARIAEQLGEKAKEFLYTVKGVEVPGHSARGLKGMSIGYATGTRGGCHHDTRPTLQYASTFDHRSTKGKPEYAIRTQNFTALDDSLVQCRFTSERGGFGAMINEKYARIIRGITGWDVTTEEIEQIGERICNLERAFNVREGIRRKDDTLPYRVMREPIPSGPLKGMYCPPEELNAMLDEYYTLRGWTKDGIPGEAKLKELGLQDVIAEMEMARYESYK
jgi:aldehyde:ferredoxin oxidoreductase